MYNLCQVWTNVYIYICLLQRTALYGKLKYAVSHLLTDDNIGDICSLPAVFDSPEMAACPFCLLWRRSAVCGWILRRVNIIHLVRYHTIGLHGCVLPFFFFFFYPSSLPQRERAKSVNRFAAGLNSWWNKCVLASRPVKIVIKNIKITDCGVRDRKGPLISSVPWPNIFFPSPL